MIIGCPNCKKQFKINSYLIPVEGRELKCGSCDHVWFYKIDDNNSEPLPLKEDVIDNEVKSVTIDKTKEHTIETNEPSLQDKKDDKITVKQISVKNKKKGNVSGKFFSYLLVSIISFTALIILIDTLKEPLISIYPDLEIILFNLFEILKDIKLFIIDLY